MFDLNISHINTQEFRREALRFERNGYYIDAPVDSLDYKQYWDEQEYFCRNGYSVGGVRITGEHYFYLNFNQIVLKIEPNKKENLSKKKVKMEKKVFFPDFWDSDWYYFTECEKAREEGQHMIILKPRRRGYSFKNGSKCSYNYTFHRKSTSLIIAEQSGYAEETMGMSVDYLNFLTAHTDFGKNRLIDKPKEIVESGYKATDVDGKQIIKGFRSRIMALTAKNNPSVARGKDANVILFEEAGSFSNLKATYRATRPTVEEGLGVSGQIVVFGTGGDFTGGIVDFEEMFYDPETYNFRAYQNEFEEGMESTQIGYFLPDYYSKGGFITNQGISQIDEAKLFCEAEIERIKRSSKDPNEIDAFLAEFPQTPKQGFIKASSNLFPKAEIQSQINRLRSSNLQHIGVPGIIYHSENEGIKFEPSLEAKPILHFPLKKDVDGEGCIIMYEAPYKQEGAIPSNLYYICHDPYAFSDGQSLGATYVIKRINNESQPDDFIVAEYVARPTSQDEYNRNLFLLSEFYNAKIGFENDRGNVIEYARRTHQLHRLEEEFDIYDKDGKLTAKLNRNYGMSMSSRQRKEQGALYLRDWLIRRRGVNEKQVPILNINKIYSIPLLEELLKFDYDGNFDRVSALLVGMYYERQLSTKPIQRREYIYESEFFKRFEVDNLDGNY